MHQKKLFLARVNFFRQKYPKKFSTGLIWQKTIEKSDFGHFRRFQPAVYNTVVTLELLRRCGSLHWSLLIPFMRLVRHENPYGVLEEQYKNTCNYSKIRSYAFANTFIRSKTFLFESFALLAHLFDSRVTLDPYTLKE